MSGGRIEAGRQLERLFGVGTVGGLSDAELLERFAAVDERSGRGGVRGDRRASWADGAAGLPEDSPGRARGRGCVPGDVPGAGAAGADARRARITGQLAIRGRDADVAEGAARRGAAGRPRSGRGRPAVGSDRRAGARRAGRPRAGPDPPRGDRPAARLVPGGRRGLLPGGPDAGAGRASAPAGGETVRGRLARARKLLGTG